MIVIVPVHLFTFQMMLQKNIGEGFPNSTSIDGNIERYNAQNFYN